MNKRAIEAINLSPSPEQQNQFKSWQNIILRSYIGASNPKQSDLFSQIFTKKNIITPTQYREIRALADFLSLKERFHNETLHASYCSANFEKEQIFSQLEDTRIEAIGLASMKGIAYNLNSVFLTQKREKIKLTPQEWPFSDGINLVIRTLLNQQLLDESLLPYFSYWYQKIADKAWDELDDLKKNRSFFLYDQKRFAKKVALIFKKIAFDTNLADLFEKEDACKCAEDFSLPQEQEKTSVAKEEQTTENHTATPDHETQKKREADEITATESAEETSYNEQKTTKYEKELQCDIPDKSQPFRERKNFNTALEELNYKIYTEDFDEVAKAQNLCDPHILADLEKNLRQKLCQYKNISIRLAHRLQRQLLAQQQKTWLFNQEDGILDTTKLTRIILDKNQSLSFKTENESQFQDTIITLLLDNSGSMRGRPITLTAICAAILMDSLERCNVSLEVLGFTTKHWKGGNARKMWLENNKPIHPGRLNDLLHIIYKDASTLARRAKGNLALMLKEDHLKENIDGEALLWAKQRLSQYQKQRKILIIISDGAPIDDSTLSVNNPHYLDRHLRAVIQNIEKKNDIELLAIGIGHDVTSYYRNAITVKSSEDLADTLLNTLCTLFAKQKRRRTIL